MPGFPDAVEDPVAPAADGLPPGTVVRDVDVIRVPWPPKVFRQICQQMSCVTRRFSAPEIEPVIDFTTLIALSFDYFVEMLPPIKGAVFEIYSPEPVAVLL